jgi:hypothetical protein
VPWKSQSLSGITVDGSLSCRCQRTKHPAEISFRTGSRALRSDYAGTNPGVAGSLRTATFSGYPGFRAAAPVNIMNAVNRLVPRHSDYDSLGVTG